MKQFLYYFLTTLSLLIVVGSVGTAQSETDESNGNANSAGTISGRVVNESGQPLANAAVAVRAFGSTKQGRTTTTDAEGSFHVSGLDPVAYLVSASLPAYVAAPRDPDVNPIGYYRVGDFVTLELIKGGVITGTVTKPSGEPVIAIPVRSYMVRDSSGQSPRYGAQLRERTTDDRGVFRIYGLAAGTYIVSAGGDSSLKISTNAYSTDAPTYAPSSTRDAAMEVSVHPGEETANVDIRYRGEPGHAVSGIANSMLAIDQPWGFTIILSSIFSGASQSNYSASQPPGARGFSFYGIADGEYYVTAQSYYPGGDWAISEPRRIKVKGADVAGIELLIRPLGSITGRVLLEDSKALECKDKRRPLFGETLVTPWHNEKVEAKDQPQFLWGLGAPALPDKQGDFAMRNLAPGQYRFNARPMAKYWYLKSLSWPPSSVPSAKGMSTNNLVDAARNWTNLKSGDRLSGLTITIAEGAASFHGRIDLAEGQKLPPKLFVYLVPGEKEKAEDVLRFFASLVSADGSFAINNVAPGLYRVIAQSAGANQSNILSKLRLPDEGEERAKLLEGAEAAKIEIELKSCQNVTDYHLTLRSATPVRNREP
jgi:hypothetical protein